jgi:hypothetical protein
MHVRRHVGRTGGPPGARCAYGAATRTGLTTRHVGARVPRDAAASIVGVSGCAWRGRRGAGVRARRHVHDVVAWRRSGTTRVAELGFENEILHFIEYKCTQL